MDWLMVFGVLLFLATPVVALALAAVALARLSRLRAEVEGLKRQGALDGAGAVVEARGREAGASVPRAETDGGSGGEGPPGGSGAEEGALPGSAERVAPGRAATTGETEPAAPRPDRSAPTTAIGGARSAAGPLVSIEELVTGRLAVWVGAAALVLAVAFFVNYSIDRGWLTETVRVALGALFGVTLVVSGERLAASSRRVAAGLTATGLAALFVSAYAAVALYDLVPRRVGFGAMAVTAYLGVALAYRRGIIVAGIGLVGGFLTPWLLRGEALDVRVTLIYLLLLQVGIVGIGRLRHWWTLIAASFVAGGAWAHVFARGDLDPEVGLSVAAFLVASSLVTALAATAGAAGTSRPAAAAAWVGGGGGLALLAVLVGGNDYRPVDWGMMALLATALMALGRLRPVYAGFAAAGPTAVAVLLAVWVSGGAGGWAAVTTAALLGGVFTAVAYAALWGARRPALWAAVAAGTAVVFFLLAWWAGEGLEGARWGAVALAGAALTAILARPLAKRRETLSDEPLAALAVAVTAFVALAAPLELDREWWTVAWAVEAALLVWLRGRLALAPLGTLAGALAAGVGIRLLANPGVLDYPIEGPPVVNTLLYAYGVPLACLLWAGARSRSSGDRRLAGLCEWLGLAFGLALVATQVRYAFHGTPLGEGRLGFAEIAVTCVLWMGVGLGLLAARDRWTVPAACLGGPLAVSAGLAWALGGLCLVANPLWFHLDVGATPVFNWLLVGFGGSVALAVVAARRGPGRAWALPWLGCAWGLGFLGLNLLVRQAFQGRFLDGGGAIPAEGYTYSAAWVLAGAILLVLGVAGGTRALRHGGLGFLLLASLKVFTYDVARLGGLWRVLSFLGLGFSLLALAYVYQRFGKKETG